MYANTDNYDPLPRKALGYGLYFTLLAVNTLLDYGSRSPPGVFRVVAFLEQICVNGNKRRFSGSATRPRNAVCMQPLKTV